MLSIEVFDHTGRLIRITAYRSVHKEGHGKSSYDLDFVEAQVKLTALSSNKERWMFLTESKLEELVPEWKDLEEWAM